MHHGRNVEPHEASNLIRAGVPRPGGAWADLGSGSGTFTLALASLLGEGGFVYAVDRAAHVLPEAIGATVVPMVGDFTQPLTLPDLDGVVMANSMHFVASEEQARALARVVGYLRPGGSFVIVEYDQRRGSRWVPYPVPLLRFEALASEVGLMSAGEIGRRRSRFGPTEMYAAAAVKAG